LGALMNKYVFGYKGSPLSNLAIRLLPPTPGAPAQIVQTGHLHKGVTLPFEITANMDVTPEGLIRIHPTKTKILGVNGDKLMKALGLSLEKMIDLRGAKGAWVHGNDITLDPALILPPPGIEGKLTSVRVEGDQLVQRFGESETVRFSVEPPDDHAANWMFYKGGTLRFGKLEMHDAEMQIVDMDPSDPFGFDLDRYLAQLVAGWSRTLPDQGLEVYMRDIDKVHGDVAKAVAPSKGNDGKPAGK
jgi:hypothetical protein